jgi:NitT/TauT family transport system substrate-binding protein
VRLLAGTHGGCIRMSGSRCAGVTPDPLSLKGKTIGLAEITGASRNAFAVLLKYHGLDPDRDVEWRQFPQALLGEALRKGEVQAIADSDPVLFLEEKAAGGDMVEVISNLSHPWQNRVCCVIGAGGFMLRENPRAAKALVLAMADAASLCSSDPHEAARAFLPYTRGASLMILSRS